MLKIQKLFFYYGVSLLLISGFYACSQGPAKDKDTNSVSEVKKQEVVKNYFYNNVSRFLGGIVPDTIAPFNSLIKKQQWISYSKSFDTIWKKVEAKSLSKARHWADTELAQINKETKTLFYPFSGPDFLYATTFFPNADKYILFGLEKTGSVPNVNKLNDQNMNGLFVAINKALDEILNCSFFITKSMNTELNNQEVDGVLPVILLFMGRTGQTVKEIKNANIEANGKVTVADTFITYKGPNRFSKGVEITFSPAGKDSVIKKLYYFPEDFTDEALGKNPGCTTYLQNLDSNVTTLVKSASYLMHGQIFSYIRNIVLKKSRYLLQDDSGIAYHFFDKTKWNIQLYGTYENPIPVFNYCYQADIKAAYAKGSKTFDFKYGYGNGRNILLAKRIK